jgi:hypothetical protein
MALAISGIKGEELVDFRVVATPLAGGSESAKLPDDDLRYLRSDGFFGTAADYLPALYVHGDRAPDLILGVWRRDVDLGVPAPAAKLKTLGGRRVARLEVKNDVSVVVNSRGDSVYAPDGLGLSTHHIYSFASKKWTSLVVPGSSTEVRSFGRWLAFVVAEAQPWLHPADGKPVRYDPEHERISPGVEERKLNRFKGREHARKDTEGGPMDDILWANVDWFPGTLLLYDQETGKLLRLETGQGDSEVVLVDGTDVYYRTNMTLYHTKIDNGKLENPTQIASDPAIGNVHWAFFTKE